MVATSLKSVLQMHTLGLNFTLSQFEFSVEMYQRDQKDFFSFPLSAWNIMMTKFVSGGKTHDNIKMNAANHDWTGMV